MPVPMNMDIAPFTVIIGISANCSMGKSFAELPDAIMNTAPRAMFRQSEKSLICERAEPFGVSDVKFIDGLLVHVMHSVRCADVMKRDDSSIAPRFVSECCAR